MKISTHFYRKEFACKCGCGGDGVDVVLLDILEDVRNYFGLPVIITSGFRCADHNNDIGGAGGSQHMYAKAADIIVRNRTPNEVHTYLLYKYPDQYGIGNYQRWTHIDSREKKARW